MAETVDPRFACPRCGNDEMDTLVWDRDGAAVTCHMCGAVYDPAEQ